ncbi:MAG TPA: HAMP domain-containing sensor histidine kinase [Steroidobacteraceae bacterium]|nr:HAMP domain-containing sensor histidine kinase [Steroidobacteraceae bacterium]
MSSQAGYRSSTARLTLTYGVIVLLLVVALQGAVFWLTSRALKSEVDRVIYAELDDLRRDYLSGGLGELVHALRSRTDSWGRTGAVYLLTDSSSTLRPIAGNLSAWPRDIQPHGDALVRFRITAAGEEKTHPVSAYIVQLTDRRWLLVGTDTSEMERSLRNFAWATVWAIGAITALIGLLGRWYAARTARRVRAFSATCDSIVHSSLSRRLEVGNTGDEYDQLSRTVNEMLERIEQQAVLLRTTFGSIAHDLRTPLYRLRVRLEEALLHSENTAGRELVGPVLEELDRVQRTLGTLLEIARAEGGSTAAGSEPVDLAQLAHEMFELYQPGMQENGLELTLDADTGITMMGKRQLLAQLIANLLENALKYVPAGGRVAMSLRGEGRRIVLAVSDNGPGISAADRERAQEPFVTLQANNAEKPSSGLGLSLVKAIVRLHRGELVLADNAPGLRVECRFERAAD